MSGARKSFTKQRHLRCVFAGWHADPRGYVAAAGSVERGQARAARRRARALHTKCSRPHVYLMRGLLNIFSLGMDQLAAQIQSHGIDASVYNHTFADVRRRAKSCRSIAPAITAPISWSVIRSAPTP